MPSLQFLRPVFMLAITLGGIGQSVAALEPADLSTRITATPSTVNAAGTVTYNVTVSNIAKFKRTCHIIPRTHRKECETEVNSQDASGVVVEVNLPTGMLNSGQPSGDSGLGCVAMNNSKIRCSNGTILAGDAARITVVARAPNTGGAVAVTAMADPDNHITERTKANNRASVTVTVRPPVNNNLPDLHAVASSPLATFDGKSIVDFNVRIYNSGPVDASNVTVEYFAVFPSEIGTPSFPIGSNVKCPFITHPTSGEVIGVRCTGVNVPAYNSVLMHVRMGPKLSNPLQPGTNYVMYGYIDPENSIQELNERNNQFNAGVLVSPP